MLQATGNPLLNVAQCFPTSSIMNLQSLNVLFERSVSAAPHQTLHTSAMLVRTSISVESITNHVSQKTSGYVPCQCPIPGAVNTCTPLMLCRCEGSWPLSTNPSVSHKITNAGRTSCHLTKCSSTLHGANR